MKMSYDTVVYKLSMDGRKWGNAFPIFIIYAKIIKK